MFVFRELENTAASRIGSWYRGQMVRYVCRVIKAEKLLHRHYFGAETQPVPGELQRASQLGPPNTGGTLYQ